MKIKNGIYLICISFILAACSAKKSNVENTKAAKKATNLELVSKHYAVPANFNTLNIRTAIKFKDKNLNQNVNADIRIEKDKQILVIVRFLGVTFVKALITPDRVSYYDIFNGQFFDGNYQVLSNWLGVDLNYQNVQNIFLGKAIDDLKTIDLLTSLDHGQHKIKYKTAQGIVNESFFEGTTYMLLKTALTQPNENRSVTLTYNGYSDTHGLYLPTTIMISAMQNNPVQIDIKYNSVSVNDNASFKYEIPKGLKQVQIQND